MSEPADLIPLPTMPWDNRPSELPLDIEECRTALWMTRGNITKAAKVMKVPSDRFRRFVRSSPRLSATVEEAQETLLDMAEEQVAEALEDTEDTVRADSMAKFVLTNLGARRGYGTKGSGVTLKPGAGSGSFTISWGDGSDISQPEEQGQVIDHDD